MKYFGTVAHVQAASFLKETIFLELTTFSISTTRDIYTKLLTFSESSAKIKVRSGWTFFVILLMLAVICKQRLLRGNEILQSFRNYKCYDVEREHFRKHLRSSTKFLKKNDHKKAWIIFKVGSNFGLLLTFKLF